MEDSKACALPAAPPPPGIPAPHSQDTLSVRVFSLLTLVLGKVTRQVRLVPWSCGPGVSRIFEELEAAWSSPRGLTTAPVQEMVRGPQAPGMEHVR